MRLSPERFPGLDEWVRLDGPAGTLPVDTSIDAMHAYLTSSAPANTGGSFDASRRTTALVDDVRDRVGALFGAEGSQVIFGPSATALVFAFTRALARTWTGSERIVCTQLDHDSNVTPWVLAARDAGARVSDDPDQPGERHDRPRRPRARARPGRRRVGRAHRCVEPERVGTRPARCRRAHPRRPAPDCTSTQWRALRISRST